MRPGTVVLVPGPLDPAREWPEPEAELPGHDVVTPVPAVDRSPYAVAWLASTARQLHDARLRDPLVIVGHGTAGPLLPALARTQRAAGHRVGGYVFVNASLPRPGSSSHLDLLRAADPAGAAAAHDALHASGDGWPPNAAQPRGHDFWIEPLPLTPDWPDAPCAYIGLSETAAGTGPVGFWARSAVSRGWHVVTGQGLPQALLAVIETLPG